MNTKQATDECFIPSRKQGQIDRTRSWVEEAMIQITEQGRYSEATISEVCEKAGIGRPTFYRHFSSKEDIIRSCMERIFDDFLSSLNAIGFDVVTVEQVNIATLQFWQKNARFFKLAKFDDIKRIMLSESDLEMSQLTQHLSIYANMDPFVRTFRHWGMKGILIEWLAHDMQQDPQDIHAALMKLTTDA